MPLHAACEQREVARRARSAATCAARPASLRTARPRKRSSSPTGFSMAGAAHPRAVRALVFDFDLSHDRRVSKYAFAIKDAAALLEKARYDAQRFNSRSPFTPTGGNASLHATYAAIDYTQTAWNLSIGSRTSADIRWRDRKPTESRNQGSSCRNRRALQRSIPFARRSCERPKALAQRRTLSAALSPTIRVPAVLHTPRNNGCDKERPRRAVRDRRERKKDLRANHHSRHSRRLNRTCEPKG